MTLGSPWRLRALRKKALAAVTSRVRLRLGFDGFALFINSTIEVHPLTAYLEVGLVYAPEIANRSLVDSPTFLELWDVANDPGQDCARSDADAELPG